MTACKHTKTRAIYEQRPPSEGRKLTRVGSRCEGCGKLLPFTIEAGNSCPCPPNDEALHRPSCRFANQDKEGN